MSATHSSSSDDDGADASTLRVLHVVDLSGASSIAPLACASAVRRIAARHRVWTIGNGPVPRAFPPARRSFAARLGRAWLAWPSLRRPLRAAASEFDVIACWSPGALSAVHAALPRGRARVVGVFTSEPSRARGALEGAALAAAVRRAPVVCFSEDSARQWESAGAADTRVAPAFIHSMRDHLPSRADARVRLRVEPHERVVCLLADPPGLGDARRFAYLTGLLSVGGTPAVGLVHARGAQMRRAARFLRECGRAWRLIAWEEALADVLPGCDAALCDIRVSPTHPLRTPDQHNGPRPTANALALSLAVAAGVPLILPRVALADELRSSGLVFTMAANTTALSLSSSAFAVLDERPPTQASFPSAPDAIDTLRELWNEMVNVPLPGFPLTPGAPVPRADRAAFFPPHPPTPGVAAHSA